MNRNPFKFTAEAVFLMGMSVVVVASDAQVLYTENLCGPGTSWMSLPSDSVIMTAEELCQAIGPSAVSVAQFYPDGSARYTFDCTNPPAPCTSSTGSFPEPGCLASACFCVDPGEGFEVVTNGPAAVSIEGCDTLVTINVPLFQPSSGTLVSIPYNSTLVTFADLGRYFNFPNVSTQIAGRDCVTGAFRTCSVGQAACTALQLVPGQSYRVRGLSATYTGTNPVTCMPPNPDPSTCPVENLMVAQSGGDNILTWDAQTDPACVNRDFEVATFDVDCLTHYCRYCPSCNIIGTTSSTTFTDLAAPANANYLVRVVGGTWNETGGTLCLDRDQMFALGCP